MGDRCNVMQITDQIKLQIAKMIVDMYCNWKKDTMGTKKKKKLRKGK